MKRTILQSATARLTGIFLLLLLTFIGCGTNPNEPIGGTPTISTEVTVPTTPTPTKSDYEHLYDDKEPITSLPEEHTPAATDVNFVDGIMMTIQYYDESHAELSSELFDLYLCYREELDSSSETSQIFALNNAGEATAELSDLQAEMLAYGIQLSELSNGAYDITAEPLRQLWDMTNEWSSLPTEIDVAEALEYVSYERLSLNGNIVTKESEGMMLFTAPLSSGFALTAMQEYLQANGIQTYSIEIGNLRYDSTGSNRTYSLAIPSGEESEVFASLYLNGYAGYEAHLMEQYVMVNDMLVHPYFDLQTGYPSSNGVKDVFVFSTDTRSVEALAYACFSCSEEQYKGILSNLPDTYAIWITEDGVMHLSDGIEDALEIVYFN